MYKTLAKIDRNIKQVKTLHDLGKISAKKAKDEILYLEAEMKDLLEKMPENERKKYIDGRIKKMGLFSP
jgi:hypothetical protein